MFSYVLVEMPVRCHGIKNNFVLIQIMAPDLLTVLIQKYASSIPSLFHSRSFKNMSSLFNMAKNMPCFFTIALTPFQRISKYVK